MVKRIALVTIGTQGDVQPYLALAMALKERGYSVVLGASEENRPEAKRNEGSNVGSTAGSTAAHTGLLALPQAAATARQAVASMGRSEGMRVTKQKPARAFASR